MSKKATCHLFAFMSGLPIGSWGITWLLSPCVPDALLTAVSGILVGSIAAAASFTGSLLAQSLRPLLGATHKVDSTTAKTARVVEQLMLDVLAHSSPTPLQDEGDAHKTRREFEHA